MPLTARIGISDSYPKNIEPGIGSALLIPQPVPIADPSLIVEIDFVDPAVQTAGYINNDLSDQPVSYWREDNAASCADQAGSGNTLTVIGTPTLATSLVSGDSNQSTTYNGTTQSAEAADNTSLQFTTAMSIECWISFGSNPAATRSIVDKSAYALLLTSAGKIQFQVRKNGVPTTLTSTATLSTSTTYHLAAVYDGALLLLYINGTLDSSVAYSGGIDATTSTLTVARKDGSTTSPTYRDSTITATSGPGTSIGVPTPTGTVTGDYILACIKSPTGSGQSISPPAGWTQLAVSPGTSNRLQLWLYGKIASSGDAGGHGFYVWNFSTSYSEFQGAMAAYSGLGTAPTGATVTNASTSSPLTGVLTPINDNTNVVGFFGALGSSGAATVSPGTKRFDAVNISATGFAGEDQTVASSSAQTETGTMTSAIGMEMIAIELVGPLGVLTRTAATLDEISVWDRALTSAEVAAHYGQRAVTPPTPTWVNVSTDVRQVTVGRGRQYELNAMEAGTCTVTLKDTARNYDPGNTLGLYAPNVLPMRQLRVRATWDSITFYPIFQGYIERWPTDWQKAYGASYEQITLTAVDGFEPLGLTAVTGTVPAGASGAQIANLLSKAAWPFGQRIIDAGAFTLGALTLDGTTDILTLLKNIAVQENGLFFVDGSSNAVFHDKNHRTTASRSTTSQGTFGDVTGGPDGALAYVDLIPSFDKDHIVNDWAVTDAISVVHRVKDKTSITNYLHRTSQLTTTLASADADTMAAFLLAHTKDPGYRFDSITVLPQGDQRIWLQMLQREISDRITVKRQPVHAAGGSQIAKDCWIERIEWTIVPGSPWQVKWQLSPAG